MKKLAMVIVGAVFLSGCEPYSIEEKQEDVNNKTYLITTEKGMPCLVLDRLRQAGISCDWDWKERTK